MIGQWIRVEADMPPHSGCHDSSTERVLVYVEKAYYPHVYFASYDYEDGGFWSVVGLSHLGPSIRGHWSVDWKVTHWMLEPKGPNDHA